MSDDDSLSDDHDRYDDFIVRATTTADDIIDSLANNTGHNSNNETNPDHRGSTLTSNITNIYNVTASSIAPIISTTTGYLNGSSTNRTAGPTTDGHERDTLNYVEIALLVAILICLIILIITICIFLFYYFSTSPNVPITSTDVEQHARLSSIAPETVSQPTSVPSLPGSVAPVEAGAKAINGPSDAPQPEKSPYMFKRLSVAGGSSDPPRRPLDSSLNTSSFSVHMAPPSPRSMATTPGMGSPEETVVKKMALDRIEQEEAKRHMDLALMAERSSSLANIGEQLKAESTANSVQTPSMPLKSAQKNDKKQPETGKTSKQGNKKKKKKASPKDTRQNKSKDSGGKNSGGALINSQQHH